MNLSKWMLGSLLAIGVGASSTPAADIEIAVTDKHEGEVKKIAITVHPQETKAVYQLTRTVHSIRAVIKQEDGSTKPIPISWSPQVFGTTANAVTEVTEELLPKVTIQISGDVSAVNACGVFCDQYRYDVTKGRFEMVSK